MTPKTPEGFVKSAVIDYFAAMRIYVLRVNSGSVMGSTNGRKWRVQLAPKGTPDILGLQAMRLYHRVLWVETKAPKGVQTPEQAAFQREAEADGQIYILARSIDDVRAVVESSKYKEAKN